MTRACPRILLLLAPLAAACARGAQPAPVPVAAAALRTTGGLSGPESVRYDPAQDVYFVSQFNGPPGELDNNGVIARLRADGSVADARFIAGGARGVTLHAPRGMYIVGDTLWVCDADGIRGFHRRTGAPLASVDFGSLQPGFLNDLARGPDGALYVTDTPRDRVYRVAGRRVTVALEDTTLGHPNGITWDRYRGRFVIVPFGGKAVLLGWRPGEPRPAVIARGEGGGYDGVEVLGRDRILVASQTDASLHLFVGGRGRQLLKTAGRPADIGVDTRRGRVAVPFVALDRVDVLALPAAAR